MIEIEERARVAWVALLRANREIAPVTSLAARRHAGSVVGPRAVMWAVDVADRIAEQVRDQVPDWPTDHSEEELRLLTQSIEAGVLQTLVALVGSAPGDLGANTESLEFIRYYVRRGIPGDHVISAVHTSQSLLTLEVLRAIDRYVDPTDRMTTTMEVAQRISALWNRFSHTVAVTYADERERWAHSEMGLRLQVVDRVMNAARVSADEASRQLGYPLAMRHIGSVIRVDTEVATREIDVAGLARRLAADAGCSNGPLLLQRGHARADVWFPDPAIPLERVVAAARWPAGVMMALGEPAEGVVGFRTTYRQAGATCRVARLRARNDKVTRYRDVRLVSLISRDIDGAVALAQETLGPLATDDPKMLALRTTLSAHQASGGNISETAKAIHTHRNTVNYRLRQIERLLPGGLQNAELACALLIAENFPHLVLVLGTAD